MPSDAFLDRLGAWGLRLGAWGQILASRVSRFRTRAPSLESRADVFGSFSGAHGDAPATLCRRKALAAGFVAVALGAFARLAAFGRLEGERRQSALGGCGDRVQHRQEAGGHAVDITIVEEREVVFSRAEQLARRPAPDVDNQ